MPTLVQNLFDNCKDVLADCGPGIVPSVEDVERIKSILDKMKPADVGLSPKMPYFTSANKITPVTYIHIYECPKFSIGIFCLPQSTVIPLHNHPGMTVFSKILFGSMHIKSYDWVDDTQDFNRIIEPPHFEGRNLRLAKLNTNSVYKATRGTSILYPNAGGNMHCFTAKTPCAVLDVLAPPYNDTEKRHCAYYYDYPYGIRSDIPAQVSKGLEKYAWLEERDHELLIVGAKYTGPKIVDHKIK